MKSKTCLSASLIAILGVIGASAADASCKDSYRHKKSHFRKTEARSVSSASHFKPSSQSRFKEPHSISSDAVLEGGRRQLSSEVGGCEEILKRSNISSTGKTSL